MKLVKAIAVVSLFCSQPALAIVPTTRIPLPFQTPPDRPRIVDTHFSKEDRTHIEDLAAEKYPVREEAQAKLRKKIEEWVTKYSRVPEYFDAAESAELDFEKRVRLKALARWARSHEKAMGVDRIELRRVLGELKVPVETDLVITQMLELYRRDGTTTFLLRQPPKGSSYPEPVLEEKSQLEEVPHPLDIPHGTIR